MKIENKKHLSLKEMGNVGLKMDYQHLYDSLEPFYVKKQLNIGQKIRKCGEILKRLGELKGLEKN